MLRILIKEEYLNVTNRKITNRYTQGVTVTIDENNVVTVKGPKGEISTTSRYRY